VAIGRSSKTKESLCFLGAHVKVGEPFTYRRLKMPRCKRGAGGGATALLLYTGRRGGLLYRLCSICTSVNRGTIAKSPFGRS
jgi:hypothetical protein